MAVPGSVNPMMLGGGAPAVYPINQSLRFNSADAYTFRRTPGSNSTSQKKFTVSIWSKRGVIASGTTSNSGRQMIVYTGASNGSGNLFGLEWRDDEVACIFNGAGSIYPQTVAKFRDPSAWYHIVVAVDTDQTTDTDRCKIYVNGVQQTLTGTLPSSGFLITNGTTSVHSVGELGSLRSNQYLAEAYYINDQQLAPTDFAKLDDNGVWIPKAYAGTFTGTNSYYLKFDSAATNGIGHDHSGNSNNFTTTNFTTSGTGTDVMSDTPVTNYATFNPLNTTAVASAATTLNNGNLDVSFNTTANNYSSYLTHGITGGKYYLEVTCTSSTTSASVVGFVGDNNLEAKRNATASAVPGLHGTFGRGVDGTGTLYDGSGNSDGSYMAAWSQNDVIMVAIDADNGKFWLGANGDWANGSGSTNQSTLTAGAEISLSSGGSTPPYLFGVGDSSGSVAASFTLNAGQRTFEYSPPTGYEALNTSNLPAPTVKDGSDYFNTVLYTGDGTNDRAITGVGFQPDFSWFKARSASYAHNLVDAVRGVDKYLFSHLTNAEGTSTDKVNSFDSDGFTIDAPTLNINTDTYVAWNWLAGNGTSSNTDGSITSTVSANPTAGFSIVSYTGTGANATVGHGLGVAPRFVIVKKRSAANGWIIGHSSVGWGNYLVFDTDAAGANSTIWQDTAPTSTVFSVGTNTTVNGSSATFIAYCFAEVEGYSKFGSYTGNGSTDGPFVFCGFRPRWVLTKRTDSTSVWMIYDTARLGYNQSNNYLQPNTSIAEGSGDNFIDILSNGFKVRVGSQSINVSGGTYIFMALAENPFGGSGVSPATAR